MEKKKKSGVALFIDIVIGSTAAIAAICFVLYYCRLFKSDVVLWVGIVSFMIMYHLGLRILMGNVTTKIGVSYKCIFFKELPFEKGLYKFLRVKEWKDKALTYDPDAFSFKKHTLEEIANTMSKAETDHWINEAISVVSIFFFLIWGQFWIFLITAVAAMIFDAQFIVIQRYNRPMLVRIIERRKRLKRAVS